MKQQAITEMTRKTKKKQTEPKAKLLAKRDSQKAETPQQ
jgi:hypothetical protein